MTMTRSLKFLVQSVAVCFSLLCVGYVVSGWAFAAQSSPAKQGADQSGATDDPFKKPLTLESYKSFFVGGERVKRPDGTLGMIGHLYVEAFIPVNAKPTPIVMLHTTTSGTNFLARANGEEGWAITFARAGYQVYVIDPPGTGRAGVDLTVNDKSKIKQGDSAEWASRKHGPEFGKAGFNPDPKEDSTPHSDPMNQMPTDTDGVNNWLAMQMTYSFDLGRRVRNAALIALLEKIGRPVIWMGWSGGGELAQQLVAHLSIGIEVLPRVIQSDLYFGVLYGFHHRSGFEQLHLADLRIELRFDLALVAEGFFGRRDHGVFQGTDQYRFVDAFFFAHLFDDAIEILLHVTRSSRARN